MSVMQRRRVKSGDNAIFNTLFSSSLIPLKGDNTSSFVRDTVAKYKDDNGVLQTDSAGVARLNSQGVLIEPLRTNLLPNGNNLSAWATNTANATKNATGADGLTSAWTLTDSTNSDFLRVETSISIANNTSQYSMSFLLKKTSGGTSPTFGVNLSLTGGTSVSSTPRINSDLGTFLLGSGLIESLNSNFWKVTIFITNNATGNALFTIKIYPALSNYNTVGDSAVPTGSAIIQNVQIETASYSSTYIDTAGASATRNADVLSYQAARNIYANAGTMFLNFTPEHGVTSSADSHVIFGSYIDTNNYTQVLAISNVIYFRNRVSGVNYDSTFTLSYVTGTTYKCAIAWSGSNKKIYINGVAGTTSNNGLPLSIASTYQIGSDGNGLNQFGGNIKLVKIHKQRLPDSIIIKRTM